MSVEKTALLPVSADDAFALVTEPDRLRRWQTVTARVDLRAGGAYRWTVVPGHVAAGTYREVVPGRRVVFGWGWEGAPDFGPDASTVTITLEPADGGTLVRLVHDGLTDEQAASHAEGWEHFLDRLQRAAATGDAGPDEWAAVPEQLTPLTAADASLAACQVVLRGVEASQLAGPTPCTQMSVGDLVEHLTGALTRLAGMVGAEVGPAPGGADPEARVATVAQQTLEAWQRRGLDGTVDLGGHDAPASHAATILPLELLVHGWDLATATGQKLPVADDLAAYVLELAQQFITPQVRAGGSFGEPVEVDSQAPAIDRLVAFTGRAVAWETRA
jgi:uncharacterized protein (TIGR03086 family)